MKCEWACAQYQMQLEVGIVEMEATVERLRGEIHDLIEIKKALSQLNSLLKEESRELMDEPPF